MHSANMSKKMSLITHRAWLALLWGRKGGIFRNRPDMGLFRKVMRKLVHSDHESRGGLVYGDHEFSFGDTPKMHRPNSSLRFKMPHIPCIKPPQALDLEDDDVMWCDHVESTCILDDDDDEEEIDVKAEQFIAKFYAQMKLQRQLIQ